MHYRNLIQRLAAGAAISACISASAFAAEPATSNSVAKAKARIETEIGDARCDSARQCKTIAAVDAVCGGPIEYFAYSVKQSDVKKLRAAVGAYGALLEEKDKQNAMVLNCTTLRDPGATCSARRCVTSKPPSVLIQ
jgi:hypothetical protein